MAGETPITIIGNIVAEPELRYTPAGAAVCNFRVASTPRPDLPRAWQADGTPPAGQWEHAHIPSLGESTRRRFVGEWEEA